MNKLTIAGIAGVIFGALLYWDAKRKPAIDPQKLSLAKKEWRSENEPIGKDLGYPQCCIKEFCDQPPYLLNSIGTTAEDEDRLKAAYIDGAYSGFIPCRHHAKQVLSGKIHLKSLILNRNPQYPPFPEV